MSLCKVDPWWANIALWIHIYVYALLEQKALYIEMLLWSNICKTCKLLYLYLEKIKQVFVALFVILLPHESQNSRLGWWKEKQVYSKFWHSGRMLGLGSKGHPCTPTPSSQPGQKILWACKRQNKGNRWRGRWYWPRVNSPWNWPGENRIIETGMHSKLSH